MIERTNDLLMQLHAAKRDKERFKQIVSDNLTPYQSPYKFDDIIVLGLYTPKRGKPVVICCDRGSLVAVNLSDFEE